MTGTGDKPGAGATAASDRTEPAGRRRRQPGGGGRSRTGRRAGESGTRQAILAAARRAFAEHGYDGATIRGIAASARVDPALVHHFYGTKEGLFAASMQLPFVPSEAIEAALARYEPGQSPGTHLVRSALSVWESAEARHSFQAMLRSALTSDQAAATLREFIGEAILRPVATLAAGTDPDLTGYRVSLVASQMLGIAISRYVLRFGPVATASPEELAAAVGPAIDRYLAGDLRPAARSAHPAGNAR